MGVREQEMVDAATKAVNAGLGLVLTGLQTGQQNTWMAEKRTEQNYSFGA